MLMRLTLAIKDNSLTYNGTMVGWLWINACDHIIDVKLDGLVKPSV